MKNKVIISNEGEKFLLQGQKWMYKNNLVNDISDYTNGDIVDIYNEEDHYIATGLLSKESHIVVRILSYDPKEKIDEKFFRERIKFAYDYRKTIMQDQFSNCRLIFGEADELPGIVIDRYNDILVSQISVYGIEMRKEMIYAILLDLFKADHIAIQGIYERNDIQIRSKEGLPLYKGPYGKCDTKTVIKENGIYLNVDVENGQKTGYFLDQKNNRMLIQKLSRNKRVMDCFSHTGGFALNAAKGGASHVVSVDISQTALNQGLANAKLNKLDKIMEFKKADVFKFLDESKKGDYDLIILDPPAFTKSRRTVDHAYNGYKEINLKAMQLLGRGGYLATCSCSRYMENALFEKMLKEAALEAGVTLKQISVTQQNGDHPILWTMNETSYLKFYIFQII